jgi:hypothetical protein
VIAALVTLSMAGGFGGLHSIGQAISGPGAPVASRAGGLPRSERATARLVALVTGGNSGRAVSTGASRTGATAAPTGTGAGRATGGAPATRGAPRSASHGTPAGQAPPSNHGGKPAHDSPTPPSNPAPTVPGPTPSQAPTAIDHLVSSAAAVTQKLPSPVGPAATHAVDQLGKTIDGIIGSPPPRFAL